MSRILRSLLRATTLATVLATAAAGAGCEKDKGSTSADKGGGPSTPAPLDLDSKDILAREPVTDSADVKHVLIGWKDLAKAYRGQMDPRAKDRTQQEAANLARDLADKLRAHPDQLDAVIKEHSEDPGSLSGDPYTVTAAARFVPEFKQLGLRLNVGEVGIVKTTYGYHVMTRLAPPPPDPLESADILARPAEPGPVAVQHVLIGWKDVPAAKQRPVDPRAKERTKADADKLAQEVLAKVRAGEDMAALMKEYSEDPGSKDTGKTYDVTPNASLVDSFKALSLRLKLDEAGLVKSPFGWHVIKRVTPPPPPPPDPLESADILAREPVTQVAKVKHILLGWKEVNAGDPRAKDRDRAALDALVKKTMAKLAKGAKIEPLMAELSEDPGSAKTGNSYDVTPNAGLVPPFKNLSLRLNVGEVGAVKTQFGIHIIQRVE